MVSSFCFKYFSLLALVSEFNMDVSSAVGALRTCGVLTTQGGIIGIGLGHLLGEIMIQLPGVEVEGPRL